MFHESVGPVNGRSVIAAQEKQGLYMLYKTHIHTHTLSRKKFHIHTRTQDSQLGDTDSSASDNDMVSAHGMITV